MLRVAKVLDIAEQFITVQGGSFVTRYKTLTLCNITVDFIELKPWSMGGGAAQVVDASAAKRSQEIIIF